MFTPQRQGSSPYQDTIRAEASRMGLDLDPRHVEAWMRLEYCTLDAGASESRRDLLEVLDDRHGNRSTIVTSQLPVEQWHEAMPDPTIADAILDRLVHNAYRIELWGESMRKQHSTLNETGQST